MILRGVPEDAIIFEDRATNSGENVRFSAEIIEREFPDARSFLIVHLPYMERRAIATWEAQYPRPYDAARPVSRPETLDEYLIRTGIDTARLANILVGDALRMERYTALGYQSDQ